MINEHYLEEDIPTVSDELEKIRSASMAILNNSTKADFKNMIFHTTQVEQSLKLLMQLNKKKEIRGGVS